MDTQFTQALQDWLNTPTTQRDINQGAVMLLQLNRNRILYNNITTQPQRYAPKLEAELRKHLRIRLDGYTIEALATYEAQTFPPIDAQFQAETPDYNLAIEDALQAQGIDPIFATDEERAAITSAQPRGKRDDHDQLPPRIQKLYETNSTRYVKMRSIYENLLRMQDQQPCDRYEQLKLLTQADTAYRRAWTEYDNYDNTNPTTTTTKKNTTTANTTTSPTDNTNN